MTNQKKVKLGAHAILSALQEEGLSHLFLVPGGMIDPLMRAFGELEWKIEPIVAAHECGAAFMADGFGRSLGSFGAVASIGGPGAANLVGALKSSSADQTQLLALVGEIKTSITGRGAFQDGSSMGTDDLAYLRPAARWAQEIPNVDLLLRLLTSGIREMLSTPSGPSVLTMPMQVLEDEIEGTYNPVDRVSRNPPMFLDNKQASNASHNLRRAKRPLIFAGSGCGHIYKDANGTKTYAGSEFLTKFAEKFEIPVATTLKAKGVFPENHPLSLGVFGYAGSQHAISAVIDHKPDLILAVGTSLNQRNTMKWHECLSNARIIHVDVSPTAFERNYKSDVKVRSDASKFFEYLFELKDTDEKHFVSDLAQNLETRRNWMAKVKTRERHYNLAEIKENATAIPLHPGHAVSTINRIAPEDAVVLVDSGAHRAFVGHYWETTQPNSYLTATTLAPMGWAIAAAVGAKLARPDRPHICFTGDGCMLMHGIEIQTAQKYGAEIIYVVMNNGSLGNVFLRTQKMGQKSQDIAKLPSHDWSLFARSFGVESVRVEQPEQLEDAFKKGLAHKGGPFLIDLVCDPLVKTPIGPWADISIAAHD